MEEKPSMTMLTMALSVALGMVLALAMVVINAAFLGVFLWVAWNCGVAAVMPLPQASYWSCVAVSLAICTVVNYMRPSAK